MLILTEHDADYLKMSIIPPFPELVKTLMLANLAYINQIDQITRVIGYPQVKYIDGNVDKKDTQGYLLHEGRNLFVIFRGTENVRDFINDIEAVKWDHLTFDDNLKVHHGFHLQYKAIESQLNEYLSVNHEKYDTITFCGHSLGAALATIATVYYYYNNNDPNNVSATLYNKTVKVQTFGCPRLGDASFGQYYSLCVRPENHWRVYNETDPAAQFPSQTTLFSDDIYLHVPGSALCLIGTTDPVSYSVGQTDNNVSLPLDFITHLDQHHTALYMSRILSLNEQLEHQREATEAVVEVLDSVVTEVVNKEEGSGDSNKVGGCVVC
jgi:hypothetical protein